ncbi:right-handed parallel beta-helix repeat-containing protein [Alsobacter sp. R-9]
MIRFTGDVTCARGCCGGGGALIDLKGIDGLIVEGGGHRIRRLSGQRDCHALRISEARNIEVRDLDLDEADGAPCRPEESCADTLSVQRSSGVALRAVSVFHAKRFGVSILGSRSVAFAGGAVADAGIVGIYVGAFRGEPSRSISITDSVVARSRANGIALQGVDGDAPGDNVVARNVLNANHFAGAYPNRAMGKPYNGGQIYVPDAANVTISENVIGDGGCRGCDNPVVWGIELGPKRLQSVVMTRNYLFNSAGQAFFGNRGLSVDDTVSITDNTVHGFDYAFSNLTRARQAANVQTDTTPSLRKKGEADYTLFRIRTPDGSRREAREAGETAGTVEAVLRFSEAPRPGAPASPIFRCIDTSGADFPSLRRDCENRGRLHSLLGYSFEDALEGTAVVYRCQGRGSDRFVSLDPSCEGSRADGIVGRARPLRQAGGSSPP